METRRVPQLGKEPVYTPDDDGLRYCNNADETKRTDDKMRGRRKEVFDDVFVYKSAVGMRL